MKQAHTIIRKITSVAGTTLDIPVRTFADRQDGMGWAKEDYQQRMALLNAELVIGGRHIGMTVKDFLAELGIASVEMTCFSSQVHEGPPILAPEGGLIIPG